MATAASMTGRAIAEAVLAVATAAAAAAVASSVAAELSELATAVVIVNTRMIWMTQIMSSMGINTSAGISIFSDFLTAP